MQECNKCREGIIEGINIIVEGGKVYFFCNDCYETAIELPSNELEFFCLKSSEYLKDKINKAKERREKGEMKWKV